MCKENKPIFTTAKVASCEQITNDVYKLVLKAQCPSPIAGQFFMLKANPSNVMLARPISVFMSHKNEAGLTVIEFLILLKGQGTKELCSLEIDDSVDLLGPVGNGFAKPLASQNVAIIGGGIGVAPVAGFASTLEKKSYSFFASFKSGSYGLDHIMPNNLVISTDDGTVGTKGILPVIFNEETIRKNAYTLVYACGPERMLEYVQKTCSIAGIDCYLSLESKMACGVGACLGCTISTTEGNKRCCKDGPVFNGKILSENA